MAHSTTFPAPVLLGVLAVKHMVILALLTPLASGLALKKLAWRLGSLPRTWACRRGRFTCSSRAVVVEDGVVDIALGALAGADCCNSARAWL